MEIATAAVTADVEARLETMGWRVAGEFVYRTDPETFRRLLLERTSPGGHAIRIATPQLTDMLRREGAQWSFMQRVAALADAYDAPIDVPGALSGLTDELIAAGCSVTSIGDAGPFSEDLNRATILVDVPRAWFPEKRAYIPVRFDLRSGGIRLVEGLKTALTIHRDRVGAHEERQRHLPPRIERISAIAIAALLQDEDAAMKALDVAPPRIELRVISVHPDVGKGYTIFTRTVADSRRISRSPTIRIDRRADGTTVTCEGRGFNVSGRTYSAPRGVTLPEIALNSARGLPIETVVRHPAFEGAGLLVERAWNSTPSRARPQARIEMRSDPISIEEARSVIAATIARITQS